MVEFFPSQPKIRKEKSPIFDYRKAREISWTTCSRVVPVRSAAAQAANTQPRNAFFRCESGLGGSVPVRIAET